MLGWVTKIYKYIASKTYGWATRLLQEKFILKSVKIMALLITTSLEQVTSI